jgi:NADH:ubiquinone oxidoreductase subunit K
VTIPLWWFLIVAAALFAIGLFCALTRRNAINVLMGVELMLNAVSLNAVTFWRYTPGTVDVQIGSTTAAVATAVTGQVFAVFIITLAAAEAAVGLALILAVYRERRTVSLDLLDALKG